MQELNDIIKNEADQCVKCGLCLPHCPTYLISKHEGESPRGRIALLENLALSELDLTSQTEKYLDHCLTCGACEKVCPIPVKYEKLITRGRQWIQQKKPRLFSLKKMILFLLPHLSLLRKKYVPTTLEHESESSPTQSIQKKTIGVLPGCIHTFVEKKIFTDTLKILTYLKQDFTIFNDFKCCGGLHLHAGDAKTFQKLRTENQYLFEQCDIILSTASGCSSVLKEHFPEKNITDIAEYFYPEFLKKNFSQKILFHLPCTSNKKFFHQHSHPSVSLFQHPHCCGASGTYFLEYPEIAQQLASPIIEEIKKIKPDVLVTTNIGCAMHLKNQLKKQGLPDLPIRHPVNFIADHLC